MFRDIRKLIERLKKYFRFRERSVKRNQRAASDNSLSVSKDVLLLLWLSYLFTQWLRAATERAQITMRQPREEEAVIKRAITTAKTAINRTTKG